jgi:hypothetical protein
LANAWPIHRVCDFFCSLFSSFHYKRFVHPKRERDYISDFFLLILNFKREGDLKGK